MSLINPSTDPMRSVSSVNQVLSLTLNGLDQKDFMISTHSTLSTPEEILAPISHQVYHPTETSFPHTPLSMVESMPLHSDNIESTPLMENHHEKTENGVGNTALTMTPPGAPSSLSLMALKSSVDGRIVEHDIIINTISATDSRDPNNKKKSIRSRFKDALKIKSIRCLKTTTESKSSSPANFSFSPSSSTPAPSTTQPFFDKRHSTSSSLLDHTKKTQLQQKHENKAKSWHPPSTLKLGLAPQQVKDGHSQHYQQPSFKHDLINSTSTPATSTQQGSGSNKSNIGSTTSTPADLSPLPTSRFLNAFQKLYQQKAVAETSSSTKRTTRDEKHSTAIAQSKGTTSLADKIKTRLKSNGTSAKSPGTTTPLESSAMAQSWSNFSQSFVPSCSVNYASQRQNRPCRTRPTLTSLKQQRDSDTFEQQKHKVWVKGQTACPESKGMISPPNRRLSQPPVTTPTYSTSLKDPLMLIKLGHNQTTRLSAPPSSRHHQYEKKRATVDMKSSQEKTMVPTINTTSLIPTSPSPTSSEGLKSKPIITSNNNNKISLSSSSSSSSFSTSSTASCSSTSYLSVSSTQSNKKMDTLKMRITRSSSPGTTLLGGLGKKKKLRVRFLTTITVQDTFSRHDYDRASDAHAVCTRLTPPLAQQIKDELNVFKLEEMKVHRLSRCNTQFFL
ncbi:hypothetical protein BC941DRAFT_512381 [Chlamydoabsidia padenii]|nr:hypothetical protein BC941DRAFT_512381 [Chlamydoabsidia padenii]